MLKLWYKTGFKHTWRRFFVMICLRFPILSANYATVYISTVSCCKNTIRAGHIVRKLKQILNAGFKPPLKYNPWKDPKNTQRKIQMRMRTYFVTNIYKDVCRQYLQAEKVWCKSCFSNVRYLKCFQRLY